MKSVFALRLRESKDDDLLPDIFELALIKYHPDFANETLDSITWNQGDVQISIKEYDDVTGDVTGTRRVANSSVPNIGGVSQGELSVGGLLAQHEPVGSLSGALNVGGDGSASYTIPIKLPRGAGGLIPDLAIQYSSNGGNGLLGLGMDISGFQTITRGRPHRIKDGYLPAEYKPLFSEQDRYYLNGEILIGIEKDGVALTRSPEDGAKYVKGNGVLYKTEKEGFDRILGHGTKGTWGPLYFTAESKNGQTMHYGQTEDACVNDPLGSGIHSWFLNKVEDVSGNYYTIEYERDVINADANAYEASDFRPKRVKFTANDGAASDPKNEGGFHHEVVFHYEDRPDRKFSYLGGIKMHQAKRLMSIDINYIGTGANRTLWSYDFKYKISQQTGRSLLDQVCQRTPGGLETPPTKIEWNEADVQWGEKAAMWKLEESWNVPQLYEVRTNKSDNLGWSFVDVNADGYLDLIRAQAEHGKDHYVEGRKEVLYNNGTSYQTTDPRNPGSTWSIPEHVWTSIDIDDNVNNALLQSANPLAKMGDFNGDGQLDFIGKRTDNSVDEDWSWSGTKFETWLLMWFPVHTRNLAENKWDTSELDLHLYNKERKKRGYRFSKGLTYDEVLDVDGDGDLDFVLKTADTEIQLANGTPVSGHYSARMFINKLNEGGGWVPGAVNHAMPIDPYNTHVDRDLGARMIDINGDGLVDLIQNDGVSKVAHININCAPGWFAQNSIAWAPPRPLVDAEGSDLSTRTVDFNGDGLVDLSDLSGNTTLIEQIPLNQRWNYVRSISYFKQPLKYEIQNVETGQKIAEPSYYFHGLNQIGYSLSGRDIKFFHFDQDLDGIADFYISRAYLNNLIRSRASAQDKWYVTHQYEDTSRWAIVGRGRFRYMIYHVWNAGTGEVRVLEKINNGIKMHIPPGYIDVGGFFVLNTYARPTFAQTYEAGNIYFNRGAQLFDGNGAAIESSAWVDESSNFELNYVRDYSLSHNRRDRGTEFLDLNGDRLTDLVVSSNTGTSDINHSYLNSGYGFDQRPEWEIPTEYRICSSADDITKRRRRTQFKDLDADGFDDLIVDTFTANPKVYINQAVSEVVTAVTDGFDKRLVIEYTRLNDYTPVGSENKSVYTKGNQATMPSNHVTLVDASLVVSRLGEPRVRTPQTDADYFWKRYYYGDLRYDQRWQSSLGFAWMDTIDATKQQCTHVEYRQDYPFQGSPATTWSRRIGSDGTYANGVTLSEETVTYARKGGNGADLDHDGVNDWDAYCVGTGGFVYSLYQTGSVKKTYDVDGALLFTTTTDQTVGDYGNVLSSTATSVDATNNDTFTATTTNSYYPANKTAWQLANVQDITVTSLVTQGTGEPRFSGPMTVTKKTSFNYFADGLLKDEILEPDMGNRKVTKSYTYDVYGNADSELVTAYNPVTEAFETRETESFYADGYGRFMTGEKNALGHYSTHEYDNASSTLVWSEGANKLRTYFFYDAFATRILTKNPDGTQSAEITQSAASAGITDPDIAFIRRTQSSGGPPASVYVDHIGRELYTESKDFHGRIVRKKTEYDALNRKYRESYPFEVGTNPSQWVTISEYDEIHRPLTTTYPDNTTQTVVYDKFKVTQTNRKGHTKTTWKDLNQRDVKCVDNGNHTMRFLYDVAGNVRETIVKYADNTTHSVTTDYDQVFNYKLSTTDPAFGTSYSRYNGFGEVFETEDANGNVMTTTFDAIGRVKTRKISASTQNASGAREGYTVYTYDTAPGAALGSLHRVQMYDEENGTLTYSSELTYDSLGRVTQTKVQTRAPKSKASLPSQEELETFYSYSTYDALGRVVKETNAGGLTVLHTYNDLGFENRLVNYHTGEIYWEPKQYDLRGNLTEEYLADGAIRTNREYDQIDPFMNRTTTKQGTTVLQDLEFDWDVVGNMNWRKDHVQGLQEDFTFDGLNRMQTSQVQGKSLLDYNYADNGNLESKPGAGTLLYEGTVRKNAVTKFVRSGGGKTTSFEYDANGHLRYEKEGTQVLKSVDWNAFGKVYSMYAKNGPKVREVDGDERYEPGQTTAQFYYDAELNRIHQLMERTEDVSQRKIEVLTTYLGSYERKIHRARDNIDDGDSLTLQKTVHKHTIGGLAIRTETVEAGNNTITVETNYQLTDHLGSITAIVGQSEGSSTWNDVTRLSFDAWGSRRNSETWSNANFAEVEKSKVTTRGFTGHEMLDEIGLVHMNGRIYHAELGRFLSPDPFVQEPSMSQNYNRYSYVLNNPISYTDPSGYFFFIFTAIFAIVSSIAAAVVAAVSFVAGVIGGLLVGLGKALFAIGKLLVAAVKAGGLLGAFIKGFAFSYVIGVAQGQGLGGALKGALIGGIQAVITAGFAAGVSSAFGAAAGAGGAAASGTANSIFTFKAAVQIIGHGVIGGTFSVIRGGKFSDGFIGGVVGKVTSLSIESFAPDLFSNLNIGAIGDGNPIHAVARSIIIGAFSGAVNKAVFGGSFANGAFTAALQHLVNAEAGRGGLRNGLKAIGNALKPLGEFLSNTVGRLWSLPNTVVGFTYGMIGVPFGAKMEWDSQAGILRFTDHPLMASAISLGDVQIYGKGFYKNPDGSYRLNRFGNSVVGEENLHTKQARILGPAYIPANLLGMGSSLLLSGHTHDRNIFEMAPERHAGLWSWQINNRN